MRARERYDDRLEHEIWEVKHHRVVETNDPQPDRLEDGRSMRVVRSPLGLVVMPTIGLDDQAGGCAVEVDDERAERMLATELRAYPTVAEEAPETALGVGGVGAEYAAQANELVGHAGVSAAGGGTLRACPHPSPLPRGERERKSAGGVLGDLRDSHKPH